MAGWRDDVRRPPAAGVVTQRDAEIALARAVGARKRTRMSMAVVGSTAAALLCLGGFGAVVYGAGPGDALYGLRTALFGEQQVTRDDRVALAAQTEMQQVQQLIDRGDWTAAQDKLETITSTVQTVEDPQRQEELQQQLNQLAVKVENRDPEATLPAAPLGPAAPVGPGAPGVQLPGLPPSDAFTLPSLPPFELPVPVPGPGVPPVISLPQIPLPQIPLPQIPLPLPDGPKPLPLPDAPKSLPLPDAPKPPPKPAPEPDEPAPAPAPKPAPKPAPAPKPVEPAPAPEAPPKLAPAPEIPVPEAPPVPAPKPAPGLAPPQEQPPVEPSTTFPPIPAQKSAGGGD